MNARMTGISNKLSSTRRAFRDVTNSTRSDDNNNAKGKAGQILEKRSGNENKDERTILRPRLQDADVPALRPQRPKAAPNPDSYQYTGRTDDIDANDIDDPLAVTAYVKDIYRHLRSTEEAFSVHPDYMECQSNINSRMRSILVDWLVDVHLKFHLIPETLYLTINILDRFLEKQNIQRTQLQLAGVTALLLASKYEEIYPPQVSDMVGMCDDAFNDDEIIAMEIKILRTLKYKITIPSAHVFLLRYLKAGHGNKKIVQLSSYILDSTLQTYDLLEFLPSQLASAAVMIARKKVGRNPWSPTLLKYTNYSEEDILPVARAIVETMRSDYSNPGAIERKYSRERFGCVAGTAFTI